MNNLLRKLDLTSLRLFVAVCQEKNIARAAEREFIAPSSVSRRIAEIGTGYRTIADLFAHELV